MINTLYLPELREMLASQNEQELHEFCEALHPARTADFMEGLTPHESWEVLRYTDENTRREIFGYFEEEKKIEIIQSEDIGAIAELIAEMPPDDRVDLLHEVDSHVVDEVLTMLPDDERRDIRRLQSFPEGTAGAVMTTEVAKLSESLTAAEALKQLQQQAEDLETIYYLYVVDAEEHLRGIVTARQLISAIGKNDILLGDLMEADLVTVNVMDDQEDVANTVSKYDILAIPVVDDEYRLLGIITYDDILDVVQEEAAEDAHRIAAVAPLTEGYLETDILTLSWKRGIWLGFLFVAAALTAVALDQYNEHPILEQAAWLILFIPLVISSGGNTGSQSATLVITALSTGDITLRDWMRVLRRELIMGLVLGGALGLMGLLVMLILVPDSIGTRGVFVVPLTLLLVVLTGSLSGSVLPLLFKRLGLDPAMMSNPFVAGLVDIFGILIYMNVAIWLL